jgi:hypothetical protein
MKRIQIERTQQTLGLDASSLSLSLCLSWKGLNIHFVYYTSRDQGEKKGEIGEACFPADRRGCNLTAEGKRQEHSLYPRPSRPVDGRYRRRTLFRASADSRINRNDFGRFRGCF